MIQTEFRRFNCYPPDTDRPRFDCTAAQSF